MGEDNAVEVRQKSLFKKIFRVLRLMVIFLIFLSIFIFLLLQTESFQNYARKEIVSYLEKKLDTKVVIRGLSISFPSMIVLEGIYVEDQTKDTLLSAQSLAVDLSMLKLLQNELQICEVKSNRLIVKINRQFSNTAFNYQFVIDAFSSKTPSIKEKAPMKMAIEHIILDTTHFIFIDKIKGNEAVVYVTHFDTQIDIFDPGKLNFDVPIIKMHGVKGNVRQTSPLEIITTTNSAESISINPRTLFLQFANHQTSIHNFEFDYSNEISAIQTSFEGLSLDIFPKKLDIASNLMAFKRIEMVEVKTKVGIQSKNSSDLIKLTNSDGSEIMSEYLPWEVTVDEISLQNNQFRFDDNTKPSISPGMDYAHLDLTKFNVEMDRFFIHKDTIAALITQGSMVDKSGFVLNNLHTDFLFSGKGIRAERLLMKTPGSELKRSVLIRYPSLDAIVTDKRLIDMDITMDQSSIQVKDILYFAPFLSRKPGFTDPKIIYEINGRIQGSLKHLNFPEMQIKGYKNTRADFSGSLTNVTDLNQIGMNLDIRSLSTSADDIRILLPKGIIPEKITIPDLMSLKGKLKGNMAHLFSDLTLTTSLGNATAKGSVSEIKKPAQAAYDVFVSLDDLQLGKLMRQSDTLGAVTAKFSIKGVGFDPKIAKANIDGHIESFDYRGYVYKNMNLDAQLDHMTFMASGGIIDPNIHLTFEAEGDLLAKKPCIIFHATVDSIKTFPLNLTSTPFIYRGKIISYIPTFDPDTLVGNVFITESLLLANNKRISLDSLSIIASYEKNIQNIHLYSDFAKASIIGKYKATQLGHIFFNAMLPYYALRPDTIANITDPYDFIISADIRDHPTLRAFLPGLNRMDRITFNGIFSDQNGWEADLKLPYIAYGTNIITSMNIIADTKNEVLNVVADIGKMTSGENITMTGTRFYADIEDQKIDFALRIGDKDNQDKYIVHGGFEKGVDDVFSFTVDSDSLLLNYDPWTIHEENLIRFNSAMIATKNFDLSKENQHLIIQNTESATISPVEIIFKDFKLSTLTGFFQTDSLLADGTLNGLILLRDIATQPNFTTDLSIKNLMINRDTIGDVHAIIDNTKAKIFATDITLSGRGNDVALVGNYYLKPAGKSSMDLILDIKSLQMKSLEGASMGNIRNSKGQLSGKVNIGGNMNSPDINGNLEFFQTSMLISKLNSVFKVDNGQILAIDNKGLKFNNFTIKDADDNRFTINGNALTKNYFNYIFDLRLKANDFQALNSSRADNQAYFGRIIFDTDMKVSGTEKAPVIDGTLKIKEGTDFTIVLPQKEPGLIARDGVVIFVDKDAPANEEMFYGLLDSLNQTSVFGMDVSVNIEIDKKAALTLVIDESNNDHLKLKGEAILNGGIDKSGKVTLTGTYELDEGAYEMSFNLLERRFIIQKGSKITWTGEPTDGTLNITAVYKANTTAVELVQDQIVGAKTDLRYRQKLPFEVHLSMSGPLLQPILAFEIKLPKESLIRIGSEIAGQVEMRLQQLNAEPSELNKQVFSLLILNRFTSQNPFEGAGGGINAESMARQSVSKILTTQLNKLAEDLISGVDINFDIVSSEDYTTGTMQNKTDLSVGVSKRLFNERLNVTIGTNIALEGGQQNNSSGNLGAINSPNVNIEYLLSKDGRYLLRAYRRNKYEGIVEGYIIETGIGFVMSVDYDRFKEIFERRKSNQSFEKEFKASELPVRKSETPPLNEPKNNQSPVINSEKKDDDEH